MKIDNLLMNIHNKDFDLEKGLEVKKYIPMEAKKTIAQSIIYDCTSEDSGAIKVDSVERYMSYVRHMITTHTNLEYTDADYDKLCATKCGEVNLLNAIMYCFGEDAEECTRILNLMMDDYMQEMTIEFAVARFLNKINGLVGGLADKFSNVDFNSMIPENMDMDTLNMFLQNYIK